MAAPAPTTRTTGLKAQLTMDGTTSGGTSLYDSADLQDVSLEIDGDVVEVTSKGDFAKVYAEGQVGLKVKAKKFIAGSPAFAAAMLAAAAGTAARACYIEIIGGVAGGDPTASGTSWGKFVCIPTRVNLTSNGAKAEEEDFEGQISGAAITGS